jgi:hypothetical protein
LCFSSSHIFLLFLLKNVTGFCYLFLAICTLLSFIFLFGKTSWTDYLLFLYLSDNVCLHT